MYAAYYCITQQHDLKLLGLAGLLCFLASFLTVAMMRRGGQSVGVARLMWLSTAGASGGFGIWSTHFVAMLAYDPGVSAGYEARLTLLSLVVAVVATIAAVFVVTFSRGRDRFALSGVLFGMGVGTMHFMGMYAVEVPGSISWGAPQVALSLFLGISISIAAFWVASRKRRPMLATLLLVASVLSLHLTAMSGVTVQPGIGVPGGGNLLSPSVLLLIVAVVSLSLLISGLLATVFALRVEKRASDSEKNLRLLIQGVKDYAIYMLDTGGHVSSWNVGAERSKGFSASEVIGQHYRLFLPLEDRERGEAEQVLADALEKGSATMEGLRARKDGSTFWVHAVIEPIRDEDGQHLGFAVITRDVTAQRCKDQRIASVTRNLDVALENMSQGLCLFDKDERLVVVNHRYSEIFRLPEGVIKPGMLYREMVEAGYRFHLSDDTLSRSMAGEHYERNMRTVREGGGTLVHKTQAGQSIHMAYSVMPDGGWVVTVEDITERLKSQEQIAYLAKHDSLTGLPNRGFFNANLAQEIIMAQRTGSRLAVVNIDLDKFKEINDQHGHAAGDRVLREIAARCTGMLEPEDVIARIGGDEFAALKRFHEMAELDDFIKRLEAGLIGEMNVDGYEIRTGASVGVAMYPSDGEDLETLLANADLAMYRAKNSLTQRICFYEMHMDEAARQRRHLVADLWSALDNDEFHLNYQIQKSVATGDVTGFEVLLRWNHPTRGNVPPGDFISLAEECGAILPIGEWVLREACREAASWTTPYRIAVNLSPIQLANADVVTMIAGILLETGLIPERLEIEITESSIISDKERALLALRQLKELGVSIAIDDFGTGYSSLETLRSFPFDKIKLDKSFMQQVETDPQSKAIVRAILALGQSLKVPVLAEGVETVEQLDILHQEGCDEAQGYLLGRPAAIEAVALLRAVA